MILVSSIYDLDYYKTPQAAMCYCEQLAYPDDLILQDTINSIASSGYSMIVDVMSADGTTLYETATSYFDYYFFYYGGYRRFNLRLKTYSPEMCTQSCWILRIRISLNGLTIYDKYTQRYCQTSCCDVPRSITIGEGVDNTPDSEATTVSIPQSKCGKPLLRIEVTFPCIDNQTGEYYGITGGNTWGFKKVTSIPGRIVQRPREITREISYNCNLQRAESFKPFLIEGLGEGSAMPTWKLNEIEGMFHAERILVSDYIQSGYYQFAGGTIAEQIYKCWELFRLKATLQSCTVRQIFGCDDQCLQGDYNMYFIVPGNATGNKFFNENKEDVGGYSDLLNYYNLIPGVTSVQSMSVANTYAAFRVQGTEYLPTIVYYDVISPRTKVFGTPNPVTPVIACALPVLINRSIYPTVCETPDLINPVITIQTDVPISVINTDNWTQEPESEVNLTGNVARLNIKAINNTLSATSPQTFFSSELIGIINFGGRPASPFTLNHLQNENIPDGSTLSIDNFGNILYSGYPTSYDGITGHAIVEIYDIYYNLV